MASASPSAKSAITVRLDGKWGKNSFKVDRQSDLARLQRLIVHALIQRNVLDADEIANDRRALIPHIAMDAKLINKIDNFVIPANDLLCSFELQTNALVLNLPEECHFTVAYKKRLFIHAKIIYEVIPIVIADFVALENQQGDSKVQVKDGKLKCCVCMEADVQCAFVPCGHLSYCEDCIKKLPKCAECRTEKKGILKVYMGGVSSD